MTTDEDGSQPTKWAKESSPGHSERGPASDALGQRVEIETPRVGVGRLPTPTRGESLHKLESSTQGVAVGSVC